MPTQEFKGYSSASLADIDRRMRDIDVLPNEKIGQHFLVNQDAIDLLVQTVNQGGIVIEVGSGPGHITERLAESASRVYGIEIDRRYRPLLDSIAAAHPNVTVMYEDALRVDFQRLLPRRGAEEGQIIASLPYHITEPFVQQISPLRLASVTLVVGKRYADSLTSSPNFGGLGRLSLLTSTFFYVVTLATIQKDAFFPVPRTDSAMVQLVPKDLQEIGSDRRSTIFRSLFLNSRQNSTLRKGLKDGFDAYEQVRDGIGSKKERNHRSRRGIKLRLREVTALVNTSRSGFSETDRVDSIIALSGKSRTAIGKLNLPESVLDKPFSKLDNAELTMLYKALG